MRQIVRYCAGCHQQGIRTELGESEPDVTIVIDKFGAHTDLCAGCRERLLGPVLEVMATGEPLDELKLSDWAKLGQQRPTRRTARRAAPASAAPVQPAESAAAGGYRCDICGKVFDSISSLGGHKKHWGNRPHSATASKPARKRQAAKEAPQAPGQSPQAPAESGELGDRDPQLQL